MRKLVYILLLFVTFAQASVVLPMVKGDGNITTLASDFKGKILLSPNPATSFTLIKAENNLTIASVAVYSLLGNSVYSKSHLDKKEVRLNIQNFKKGKYLIKVALSDGSVEVKALVKQ